jgi:hypothetical protein
MTHSSLSMYWSHLWFSYRCVFAHFSDLYWFVIVTFSMSPLLICWLRIYMCSYQVTFSSSPLCCGKKNRIKLSIYWQWFSSTFCI